MFKITIKQNSIEKFMKQSRRFSERKSQLKFYVEDFCLALTSNSDPVVSYLLSIMEWEASLGVQTDSILHKVFQNQLHSVKCRIKQQLKLMNPGNREKVQGKVMRLVSDYKKINQLFSYCLILSQQPNELCSQLQKFKQYRPNSRKLIEDLEEYLNDETIFQTIFHCYRETYNVNKFTAQLIQYLYSQFQANLLTNTQKFVHFQHSTWNNPNYQQLSSKSINFKRLNQINRKYDQVWKQIKNSEIAEILGLNGSTLMSNKWRSSDLEMREKLGNLHEILKKIKGSSDEKSLRMVIVKESDESFKKLNFCYENVQVSVKPLNKDFILENLMNSEEIGVLVGGEEEEFSFLKKKILKLDCLVFLNSILKSLNVLSYIYNDLDLQIRTPFTYSFDPLVDVIESQFVTQTFWSAHQSNQFIEHFFLNQQHMVTPDIFGKSSKRILFPSAIRSFYHILSNILKIQVENQQQILSILHVVSQQLSSVEETIASTYNIVKGKQITNYSIVQQLICLLLLQSNFEKDRRCFDDYSHLMTILRREQEKAGIMAQIISELDSNYQIKQPLQQLIKISYQNIAFNLWENSICLYRAILSEIIKVRNGLKLDHHYSLNQIHEHFSLIPISENSEQSEKQNGGSKDLYFEELILQISQASQQFLYLPKLFFFFSLQMQLKLTIFKLQLYWSTKKELMFEKKLHIFKEFITTFCSPIFELVQKSENVIEILQKIDELEKYIIILSNEVSRFHLVQQTYQILKKFINCTDLKEHIDRLEYEKLWGLNNIITRFNPIENYKHLHLEQFSLRLHENIKSFSRIRLGEMEEDQPEKVAERAKLSHCIYFLNSFSGNTAVSHHKNLSKLRKHQQIEPDIIQIKQEESIRQQYYDCFKGDDIENVTRFYERIILISIQQTINQLDSSNTSDHEHLKNLIKQFPHSDVFASLDKIEETNFWKSKAMLSTKYHEIYQLMFFLNSFDINYYQSSNKQSQPQDKLKTVNLHRQKFQRNDNESVIINRLYILSLISATTRLALQRKIQDLQLKIVKNQPLYKAPKKYLKKTLPFFYKTFCDLINFKIAKTDIKETIDFRFDPQKIPSQYVSKLKQIMLSLVNSEVRVYDIDEYSRKQQIQLFGEIKGYEVTVNKQQGSKKFKIGDKKITHHTKKQAIFPYKSESDNKLLKNLRAKAKIDILKRTLHIRKDIAKLQLQEKKIKNQITWETQRLKHNVVENINQFIMMSKLDQQQRYRNFKHDISYETIKGIENVIDEQTQMYMKKQKSYPDHFFITDVEDGQDNWNFIKKDKLLNLNVKAICENMKMIKIFWAWKKLLKRSDNTRNQWIIFNENVQKILNNRALMEDLSLTNSLRKQFLHDDVECEMTKQNNFKINAKIQELKIGNLEKKVCQYRSKLILK